MKRLIALCGLILVATGVWGAPTEDYLDSFNGVAWSPAGDWLAFTPPEMKELFVISTRNRRSYLLRPLGQVALDTSSVFSPEAPKELRKPEETVRLKTAPQTRIVPTMGNSRLASLGWSKDGAQLAFQVDRKMRALFSPAEEKVAQYIVEPDLLPWWTPADLSLGYQLLAASKEKPAEFLLKVQRRDGKIVRQVAFFDDREIRAMTVLRYRGVHLLSPDRATLVYPRVSERGWQLFAESLTDETAKPRSLTDFTPDMPVDWRFSRDGRQLAVVENRETIVVGPINDWKRSERVPFNNLVGTFRWSPDGRFLACQDELQLSVLTRQDEASDRYVGDFQIVSKSCSPRVWGWRGTQLIFGDAKTDAANLYSFDAENHGQPVQIVEARAWGSAPREISLSPDGTQLACLVSEFDSEGRPELRLWKIDVKIGGQWELLYAFRRE